MVSNSKGIKNRISAEINFAIDENKIQLVGEYNGNIPSDDVLFELPFVSRFTSEFIGKKCNISRNKARLFMPEDVFKNPQKFIFMEINGQVFVPNIQEINTPWLSTGKLYTDSPDIKRQYDAIATFPLKYMGEKGGALNKIKFKGWFKSPWFKNIIAKFLYPFDKFYFEFGLKVKNLTYLQIKINIPKNFEICNLQASVEKEGLPREIIRKSNSSIINEYAEIDEALNSNQILWFSGYLTRLHKWNFSAILIIGILLSFLSGMFISEFGGVPALLISVVFPILLTLTAGDYMNRYLYLFAVISALLFAASFGIGTISSMANIYPAAILIIALLSLLYAFIMSGKSEEQALKEFFSIEFLRNPEIPTDVAQKIADTDTLDPTTAEPVLEELRKSYPTDTLFAKLGSVKIKLGKYKEVEEIYKELLECYEEFKSADGQLYNQNRYAALINLGYSLMKQLEQIAIKEGGVITQNIAIYTEKAREAHNVLFEAKKIMPLDELPYLYLADTYYYLDNVDNAIKILEEALSVGLNTGHIRGKLSSLYSMNRVREKSQPLT